MTSRERMIIAMKGGQPAAFPLRPNTSNMIPCRLTGKPFWDIYLYQDPPLWQAYINAVKYFGFDGWLPGIPFQFDHEVTQSANAPKTREAIVKRTSERIYTRYHTNVEGKEHWSSHCNVYYIADPPTHGLPISKVGLSESDPTEWEDVEPRTNYAGLQAFHTALELMGERGVIGLAIGLPGLNITNPQSIYEYYDDHDKVVERCEKTSQYIINRTKEMVKLNPDLILIGISGHMISNPEPIFRELSLSTLKGIASICKEAGVVSQIHCCGPEYDLVKMSAEETDLDNINPLEHSPMGDCDLAQLKREFGKKISLMGNLHTTEIMLRGTVDDVERASKKAIDDAADGGGFILSTGDQCGRDTPDKNIFKMIDVARTYGKY